MAQVSDWQTEEVKNTHLDELTLSGEGGLYTNKLMCAVKKKFDDVDGKLSKVQGAYVFKGTKADMTALEAVTSPAVGDVYSVTALGGENYAWDGTAWDNIGTSDANVVHKSGDETLGGQKTFTSDVSIKKSNPHLVLKEENVTKGTRPETEQRNGLYLTDASGNMDTGILSRIMYLTAGQSATAENSEIRITVYPNIASNNNNGEIVLACGVSDSSLRTPRLFPHNDNSEILGSSGKRWKEFYCANDTINTSDEQEKTQIDKINDAVLDAWGKINYVNFKFKDSVKEKGVNARIHSGIIAQKIKDVFDSSGLDAFAYALICKDVEDDKEIWGIRYSEALCLEAAYQRRMVAKLEKRIEDLEEILHGVNQQ